MNKLGPKDIEDLISSAVIFETSDGLQIIADRYPDGCLYEASFPADTHGRQVAALIAMIPAHAVSMDEWETEDGRTYAAFWERVRV